MNPLLLTTFLLSLIHGFQIRGTVTDASDAQPLSYSHVAVFDVSLHRLLAGTITDADGYFLVDLAATEPVALRISAVGYETLWISLPSPADTLLTVSLTPATVEGEEIVILARALPAVTSSDRIRYYPAPAQLASAGTALDILRFLPGVQINLFREISLDGHPDVLILVNGVRRDRRYVEQLSPDRIERIEVFPVAPAGYESTGGGAINFILREPTAYQLSGRVHAEIPTLQNEQFLFPNASLQYSTPSFTFQTGYTGERTRFRIHDEISYQVPGSHQTYTSKQQLLQSGYMHRIDAGVVYEPGGPTRLEAYGWMNTFGQQHNGRASLLTNRPAPMHGLSPAEDTQGEEFERRETDRNLAGFTSLRVQHQAARRMVSAEAGLFSMQTRSEMLFNEDEITSGMQPYERIWNVRTDVTEMVSSVQVGYGASWNYAQRSGYRTAFQDSLSHQQGAVYLTATRRALQSEFQVGLRTEYHWNNEVYWLPSLLYHHRFHGGKTSIRAAYRSTVSTPGLYQRHPAAMYVDPIQLEAGNPGLRPSHQRIVQTEWTRTRGSGMFSVRYALTYETSSIQRTTSVVSGNSNIERPFAVHTTWMNTRDAWQHRLRTSYMLALSPGAGLQVWAEPGSVRYAAQSPEWVLSGGGSAYWQPATWMTLAMMVTHEGRGIGAERIHHSGTLYFIHASFQLKQGIAASLVSGLPFSGSFVYDGYRSTVTDLDVRSEGRILMSTFPVWFTLTMEMTRSAGSVTHRNRTSDAPRPERRSNRTLN